MQQRGEGGREGGTDGGRSEADTFLLAFFARKLAEEDWRRQRVS